MHKYTYVLITERASEEGNEIGRVRPCVRLFVSTLPTAFDVDNFACVGYGSWSQLVEARSRVAGRELHVDHGFPAVTAVTQR